MLEQQEVITYKFTFKHTNHSVFTGTIKATSIDNRDAIMLNLLFNRYRRKLPLTSQYGSVEFEKVSDEKE